MLRLVVKREYSGSRYFVEKVATLAPPERALIVKLIEILESQPPESRQKLNQFELSLPETFAELQTVK